MAATRISCKRVTALSAAEYAQCQRLNVGKGGMMRDRLRWWRQGRSADYGHKLDPSQTRARVLLLRDSGSDSILAWGLLGVDGCAFIYVRARWRRRGLGTRLLRQLVRIRPDIRVCPWDAGSCAFYRKAPQKLKIGRLRCTTGYSLNENLCR